LAKFAPIEQHYHAITESMRAALVRQRSMFGGQAFAARGQIFVAINHAAVEAEQLPTNMESARQDSSARLEPFAKYIIAWTQTCESGVDEQSADHKTACDKFVEVAKKFKQSVQTLSSAFQHVEQAWVLERREQEAIIHAADLASR
jgi:hypothetical protein